MSAPWKRGGVVVLVRNISLCRCSFCAVADALVVFPLCVAMLSFAWTLIVSA